MRLLLLGLSIVASLALLEVGLRLFTPFPVTATSNKTFHPMLGYVTSSDLPGIDEWGFRNTGLTLADADIAVVGDSMAYGANVTPRETFPSKLADLTGARVYNMGVGSYGIYHYAVLMKDLAETDVDHVVLTVYTGNDIANHCRITTLESWPAFAEAAGLSPPSCANEGPALHPATVLDSLVEHSAVVNAGKSVLGRYREVRGPFLELPAGNRVQLRRARSGAKATSLQREDRRMVFRDSLLILRDAERRLREAGIRLWVVLIPTKEVVMHEWAIANDWPVPESLPGYTEPQRTLIARYARFLETRGIPYRDATPTLVAALDDEIQAQRQLYPRHDDGHPHARGYLAYAQAALDLLGTKQSQGVSRLSRAGTQR